MTHNDLAVWAVQLGAGFIFIASAIFALAFVAGSW